jgi:arylformamidase
LTNPKRIKQVAWVAAAQADGDASPVLTDHSVDLSQPLFDGAPAGKPHGVAAFPIDVLHQNCIDDVSITHMRMSAHVGTHVDAPRHFFPDGRTVDQYAVSRFVGEAVVLDLRREGIQPVTADELCAAGMEIKPGDFAFLYFGYAERFGRPEYHDHPYLSDDGADWLIEQGVGLLGVDTLTPDIPERARPKDFHFPVHRRLLGNDVLIIENLGPGLGTLAGERVRVVAAPLCILGADGAPVRVVARKLSSAR